MLYDFVFCGGGPSIIGLLVNMLINKKLSKLFEYNITII